MKIIIKIEGDGVDFWTAAQCVDRVIKQGRISDEGRSYCYVTVFEKSIHVAAVANKNSDTFTVWRSSPT